MGFPNQHSFLREPLALLCFSKCDFNTSPREEAKSGTPLHKESTVQTVFVQIAFQPPHPQANGRFVGAIFAENLSIFENSGFDFGNGYFDDYYGQTLFLDCILMDIMIYNGEIWCKLSALVMVYIY